MRGFGGQMPWLAPYMLMYILTLPGTIMRFRTLVIDSCMKRLDAGAHNKDLMFHLVRIFYLFSTNELIYFSFIE